MNYIKKLSSYLVLFLTLCLGTYLNAQPSIDSLKTIWEDHKQVDSVRFNAMEQYYISYNYSQPDSVLKILEYHLQLAKKKDNQKEIANFYTEKGFAHFYKNEPDKCMNSFISGLDVLYKINDSISVAKMEANIGSVYRYQNNYVEAVKYYTKSIQTLRKNNNIPALADVVNNLGLIYYDIRNYDLALENFNLALDLYKESDLDNTIGNIWLNIGSVYFYQGDYESAVSYSNKALTILKKEQNVISIPDCYHVIAKSNLKLNNITDALNYARISLELNLKNKEQERITQDRTLIATITMLTNVEKATTIAEENLAALNEDASLKVKVALYDLLYKCYKTNNEFDASLEMYEKYVIYNDSLDVQNNKMAVVREILQNQFNAQLEETESKNKDSQKELKEQESKKTWLIALASIFIIICILFYGWKTSIKNKEEKALLLEELQNLKKEGEKQNAATSNNFELNRDKIELFINRKLNETDWKVLEILVDDPVISNKDIAAKAFMSVDGIGSSLRRMYEYFNIKESKYKKISLLLDAIKISNQVA